MSSTHKHTITKKSPEFVGGPRADRRVQMFNVAGQKGAGPEEFDEREFSQKLTMLIVGQGGGGGGNHFYTCPKCNQSLLI